MAARKCSTCRKALPEELFWRKPDGELGKTCTPCREKYAAKRRARAGAPARLERRAPEPRVLLDAPAPGAGFQARLVWADARDVLGEGERPDLVVADPPYGTPEVAYAVLELAIRRLRPGGRICVFGDCRHHADLEQAGGALIRILEPLIWDKGRGGPPDGTRAWGPAWELVAMGERVADGSEADREAARAVPQRMPSDAIEEPIELIIGSSPEPRRGRARRGRADVEEILRRYRPVRLRRPAVIPLLRRDGAAERGERPLELLKQLISLATRPGDLVLDPFAGAGAAGVAALELGRRFLGVEIDEAAAERAADRLRGAQPEASEAPDGAGSGFAADPAGGWPEPIGPLHEGEPDL